MSLLISRITVGQVKAKLAEFDNTEYNACMARINAKAEKKAADAAAKKAGTKKSKKEKKSAKSETTVTQTVKQVGAATVTATAIIGGSIPMEQLATGADITKLQAVNAEWELLDSITNAALVEKGLNPGSEEGELVRRLIAMFFADPVTQKKYSDMAAANGEIDAEVLDADMQAFFTELEKTGHPLIEAGKALKVKRDAAAVEKANAKAARKHASKPTVTVIKSGEQAPQAFENAMTAAMKNAIAGGEKK